MNAPSNPTADHRRNHRSGVLSRITRDPEIETFIRARIHTRTFPEIAAQIAAAFPPDRRMDVVQRGAQRRKETGAVRGIVCIAQAPSSR